MIFRLAFLALSYTHVHLSSCSVGLYSSLFSFISVISLLLSHVRLDPLTLDRTGNRQPHTRVSFQFASSANPRGIFLSVPRPSMSTFMWIEDQVMAYFASIISSSYNLRRPRKVLYFLGIQWYLVFANDLVDICEIN